MPNDNSPLRKFLEDGEERFADLEKRLDGVEKKTKNRSISFGGSPTKEEREFSIVNLIRGAATGRWYGAELEKEASESEMKRLQRDLGYSATPGSYVVPELYLGQQFIDTLNAKAVVLAAGATQLNGLSTSPVVIPKKVGNVTTYYKAEHGQITESDVNLNEVSMAPKHLTALSVMSREFMAWSNPSAEAMVRNDIATQLALRVDAELLEGDGLSNNPAGLYVNSGVTSVSIGAVTVEDLYDMLYQLEANNAAEGKLAWIMHPRTFNQVRQLRAGGSTTTDGPFLVQPDVTAGARYSLLGLPVHTTTQISIDQNTAGDESWIALGNWSDLIHATWIPALEISASMEAEDYFRRNQVGIRAIMHHDCEFRHDESFVIGDGVSA